jgi:glycosyltransferase involved in cell wall biosynthesis
MRLLAISFPCCEPIRQDLYADLEARTGWDVSIVLPSLWRSEYGERRPQRWPAFGGNLITIPVLVNGSIPLHFYRARMTRILERARPDAIFVHHEAYALSTFQTFVANERSIRVPIGFYSSQNRLKHYPWPFSACEAYVYQRAAFALPITESVAGVLRSKGYRGPLEVLPTLAVDVNLYHPNERASARPRATDLTVGFVGRLAPEKGVDTLLAALTRPEAQGISAVIAGDGPLAPELKESALRLGLEGRVEWRGYLPHDRTPDFYRAVDLVVVPTRSSRSYMEQFGRVVPEALACGVPVVTSDNGELPHLVDATGAGWIFPEGDAGALAAILGRLRGRQDILREIGGRGRNEVKQRYSLEHVGPRFAAVIASAAGEPNAG